MTLAIGKALVIAAALGVGLGTAIAQPKVDVGKREYDSNCASCHGARGKGDGPNKPFLTKSPSDLTVLAKNNGGVMPVARMYEVIEGGRDVVSHGTRDMPTWGFDYKVKAAEYYIDVPYDAETYVRTRILSLIEYIHRLQAK